MDEKSTPISSLNNDSDSNEVYNDILSKYNNLNQQEMSQEPLNLMPPPSPGGLENMQNPNPDMRRLENKFENSNINQDMYRINMQNEVYQKDYNQELKRINDFNRNHNDDSGDDDEEEYEEIYEVPKWRIVLNEIRIPLYIFIFIFLFFNSSFGLDKFIQRFLPTFVSQHNDCNWKGVLLKAVFVSLFSYLMIKYVYV